MKDWMLADGETLQIYLFFGCFAGLLLCERLIPRRRAQDRPWNRWWTNLGLTDVVIVTLPLVPVAYVTAALWAEANGFGLLNALIWVLQPWMVVLLTLLIRGFVSFGTHYLNHKIPLLWRFHRVHHLDTELDVTSTVRFHPLETLALGLEDDRGAAKDRHWRLLVAPFRRTAADISGVEARP